MDDLHLKVTKLNKHWGRSILDNFSTSAAIFSAPTPLEQAIQSLSASDIAARLNGHGDDLHNWENEFGVVTTLSHSLVKGMTLPPPPPPL